MSATKRRWRLTRTLLALGGGWLLWGAPAAMAQDGSPWAALTAPELAQVRGGYYTAGGLTFDFGADVRTFVDGQLALSTSLTWTPGGLQTDSAVQAGATPPSGPQLASALSALGYAIGPQSGGAAVVGASGVGATLVLHQLDGSHIGSVVLNTADGRSIRQETTLTLTLPQLPALQQSLALASLNHALTDQMSSALRSSSPH